MANSMVKFHEKPGLNFDDVLLVPKYSKIRHRASVSLRSTISVNTDSKHRWEIDVPIISANMDTITGLKMARAMSELGGCGFIHRYQTPEKVSETIRDPRKLKNVSHSAPIVASIGVDEEALDIAQVYIANGADIICIDIAHGHSERMRHVIEDLHAWNPKLHIIAGNIVTGAAAKDLIEAGATGLKVGIGPGSVCRTRVETGCGVPQLTAIMEVAEVAKPLGIPVIADGGLKTAGDIVKALAAGANTVMTGGLLAGTIEAESRLEYRGMASKEAQENWKGSAHNIEGIAIRVEDHGSVYNVIDHLIDGIRSGLSYCGASNIEELWERAEFILTK
jgi:IMP dehydrogenase